MLGNILAGLQLYDRFKNKFSNKAASAGCTFHGINAFDYFTTLRREPCNEHLFVFCNRQFEVMKLSSAMFSLIPRSSIVSSLT
ncbi:hypothetical protein [Shewanella benthica]|uniref:Uncharacterized protein n=1 Tax=Shewanella benthica KT99 TaxID=314608 RepID=A9EJ66_9GAMM|nr:hypothetical protein [Shewanella benthica]EDP99671.1 hypothetical protein KT99_13622 [Shewanella benthica KT99]